jgi:hypothetical protein
MSACEICGTHFQGLSGSAEVDGSSGKAGSAEVGSRQLCPACAIKGLEYRERVERRTARWQKRADKAQAEFIRRERIQSQMADAIPFGQPILVGHHSEKRDRAFRARIHQHHRKGMEAYDKAREYARKAHASEKNRAISSDDPLAVIAMREKIAGAEKNQALMKAANKAIRKYAKQGAEAQVSALVALGLSERAARNAIEPDYMGRVGFPD